MKFELDDKTVLKICSATAAGFGAYALGAPRQFQVSDADFLARPPSNTS